MPGSILGNAVRRVEDPDLLMGRGTFIDNLRIDGLLRVAFVRSPMAHADGAPILFDEIGSNLVGSVKTGDPDPLAGADVIVRGRFENQRIAVVPLEGNAIAAIPEDPLKLYISTQMPHMTADMAARFF